MIINFKTTAMNLGKISRKKAEEITGETINKEYSGKTLEVKSTERGIEITGSNDKGRKSYNCGFPHYTPRAKALKDAAKK